MFAIGGVTLPEPNQLEITLSDIRGVRAVNALGQTVRDTLGTKRALRVVYTRPSGAQSAQILSACDAAGCSKVSVSFPGLSGIQETAFFHCAGVTAALARDEESGQTWRALSVTLEEV